MIQKIKITEEQLGKIQEDSLVNKSNVDGWIEKSDISALAHHYSKSDDTAKNDIYNKAKSLKGDVFANRIKMRAKGVSEGLSEDELNELENSITEEIPMDDEPSIEETTTTGSVGGQYSSKYFLKPEGKGNNKLLYKGGSIVEPNRETHISGINSIIKGKLKEMENIDDISQIPNISSQNNQDVIKEEDLHTILNKFEDEELSDEESIGLIAYLTKTGMINKLNDNYKRLSEIMLEDGIIDQNGNVNWEKAKELVGTGEVSAEPVSEVDQPEGGIFDKEIQAGSEGAVYEGEPEVDNDKVDTFVCTIDNNGLKILEFFSSKKEAGSYIDQTKSIDEAVFAVSLPYLKSKGVDPDDQNNWTNVSKCEINEETLTKSPAIANLEKIHAETKRLTKGEMNAIKNDTLKASETKGTQFVQEVPEGEKPASEKVKFNNSEQEKELPLIKQGMEDLDYDLEPSTSFKEMFKKGIDPVTKSKEVTDQFGHTTPAMDLGNIQASDVGKNILKNLEKKKKEAPEPRDNFIQRVEIVKEQVEDKIVKETDDYIITESEQKEIDQSLDLIKKMVKYNPSKYVSTKGNKTDDSLFKRK